MSRSFHSGTFSSAPCKVAAYDAREPRDLLARNRVSLVRHRGRAFLLLREELLDLANLGPLQASDLGRRSCRGCSPGSRAPTSPPHDGRAEEPASRSRRARDRASSRASLRSTAAGGRTFPRRPRACRRRRRRAHSRAADAVALHLGEPERELHAERHRLGVDAVRPADHDGLFVLQRPPLSRRPGTRRRSSSIKSVASRSRMPSAVSTTS